MGVDREDWAADKEFGGVDGRDSFADEEAADRDEVVVRDVSNVMLARKNQ